MVDLLTLAQTVGLPVAMLLIALWTGLQGTWVWGRELAGCEERLAALRADYEERLAQQRTAHLAREAELAAATDKWQRLFMGTIPALRSLTSAVEATAHKKAVE